MPNRFFKYSRTEPARTILFCVALLVVLSQVFVLTPWYINPDIETFASVPLNPSFWERAPTALVIGGIGVWSLWASLKNRIAHMAHSSMALYAVFFLAALTRAIFAPHPGNLMWVGYFMLSLVMATVHIYMQGVRKGRDRE